MPRGRHRRPTHRKPSETARRTVIGATVVGTAAGPAIGLASPASASGSYGAWLRVAACESSGNWAINTGNGYYGGLQFAPSTWSGYGGGRYAPYANEATEWQQITIAERVLASQGVNAWPVCGPRAGLSMADVYDTVPSSGAVRTTSVVRHAAPAVHHAVVDQSRFHLTATPRGRTTGGTYVVRPGDTLSSIARAHHLAGGWQALWKANQRTVRNPNLIFVGQRLVFPSA